MTTNLTPASDDTADPGPMGRDPMTDYAPEPTTLSTVTRDEFYGSVSVELVDQPEFSDELVELVFSTACTGTVVAELLGGGMPLGLTPADLRVLGDALHWLAAHALALAGGEDQ